MTMNIVAPTRDRCKNNPEKRGRFDMNTEAITKRRKMQYFAGHT
jgi:hypothetical protein